MAILFYYNFMDKVPSPSEAHAEARITNTNESLTLSELVTVVSNTLSIKGCVDIVVHPDDRNKDPQQQRSTIVLNCTPRMLLRPVAAVFFVDDELVPDELSLESNRAIVQSVHERRRDAAELAEIERIVTESATAIQSELDQLAP